MLKLLQSLLHKTQINVTVNVIRYGNDVIRFQPFNKYMFEFFLWLMTQKFAISLASFYNFGYFDNEMSHFLEGWNLSKIEALSLSLNCPCVWNLESLNYNTIVTKLYSSFSLLYLNYLLKNTFINTYEIRAWLLKSRSGSYDPTILQSHLPKTI